MSRLEREGETISSALEAAGQAPWLEPDMAVTEKPALWPVLEEWRAHVQRAEEADVLPFHLVGCDALMARMGALAEKEALPGALAGVLVLAVVPGCAYMVLFLSGRWRLADGMLLGLADFVSRCGYSVEGPVIDLERFAGAVAHEHVVPVQAVEGRAQADDPGRRGQGAGGRPCCRFG